jgi:hypothetical protein
VTRKMKLLGMKDCFRSTVDLLSLQCKVDGAQSCVCAHLFSGKQRQGKKRMKTVAGGIELPQEAFLTLIGGHGGANSDD